jgi:hypothetical protein
MLDCHARHLIEFGVGVGDVAGLAGPTDEPDGDAGLF